MREDIISTKGIACMAHLGARAFDAIGGEVVQTTATVFENGSCGGEGTYLRLVDGRCEAEKSAALRESALDSSCAWSYEVATDNFKAIPGWRIAYWASPDLLQAFSAGLTLADLAQPRQGLSTGMNDRFLRLWWECPAGCMGLSMTTRKEAAASGLRWFPCNKGGSFRKWYGNSAWVVDWADDGVAMKAF